MSQTEHDILTHAIWRIYYPHLIINQILFRYFISSHTIYPEAVYSIYHPDIEQ